MDYKTLGKNVKKYRLLREMRQEDLAAICDCSVSHIGHIEGGHGKASLEMVVHIANKLDVTVDQLLCDYYDDPTLFIYVKLQRESTAMKFLNAFLFVKAWRII